MKFNITNMHIAQQTIRFNRAGYCFWSRHTLITVMQPKLNLEKYPDDSQIIHLRCL
jgi:hypothetical protein